MSPEQADAVRDALALVQCAGTGDHKGMQAVLNGCDEMMTLVALAYITSDLIQDYALYPGEVLDRLRDEHTA